MSAPTTFGEVAARFNANGYPVIPISPGIKYPLLKDWQNFRYTPGCERQYPQHGAGVLAASCPGVDIDVSDEEVVLRIENMVRDVIGIGEVAEIPRRVGRWPRALLPFRTDKPFAKKKTAEYKLPEGKTAHVEILASGQQWVANHIHPDTHKAYEWNGHDLLNTPRSDLFLLTEAMAEKIISEAEHILEEYGERLGEPGTAGQTNNNANSGAGKIHDGARNDTLFKRACALRAQNWDESAILAAVLAENTAKCAPPLPEDELRKMVANVVRRYTPGQESKPQTGPVTSVSAVEFMASYTVPEMILENIIPSGSLYALTARTGHGKTAVVSAMEFCWDQGRPLGRLHAQRGAVLSLQGENTFDKQARLIATYQDNGVPGPDRLRVLPRSLPIAAHMEELRRDAERFGPYSAVTVDTSAAYFYGDDENNNPQARAHAADLRLLTELAGRPAVIALCHPVKNAENAEALIPRGGGAFLNEIDGNLTCWLDGDRVQLHWTGKLRGPGFEPINFQLRKVALTGKYDSKGKQVESIVAVPIDDYEAEKIEAGERSNENTLLLAMLQHPGGSIADWAFKCYWTTPAGAPLKSKVHRLLIRLARERFVKQSRGRWTITDSGKKEVER